MVMLSGMHVEQKNKASQSARGLYGYHQVLLTCDSHGGNKAPWEEESRFVYSILGERVREAEKLTAPKTGGEQVSVPNSAFVLCLPSWLLHSTE